MKKTKTNCLHNEISEKVVSRLRKNAKKQISNNCQDLFGQILIHASQAIPKHAKENEKFKKNIVFIMG